MTQAAIRTLPVALLCLGLAACVSAEDRSGNEAKVLAAREESGMRPEKKLMGLDEAKAAFVGTTRNVKAYQFGTQISYLAPDGAAYLWFPGNPVVLRGRWSFRETGGFRPYAGKPVSETSLCFEYGPQTANAWSRQRGGIECALAGTRARMTLESASGDVFGLSDRTSVPFVLTRAPTSFDEIRKRISTPK